MDWLITLGIIVVFCFGFVLLFGPPYLPTLSKQATLAIDAISLRPGETLLELGCGDGKILKLAAAKGLYVVGYELNPILVVIAYLRTWQYRKQVKVVWGNFWNSSKWPETDGIFVFLVQKHMSRLDKKIESWHKKPVKLVSFAFPIPEKKTIYEDKSGVYLYLYQ